MKRISFLFACLLSLMLLTLVSASFGALPTGSSRISVGAPLYPASVTLSETYNWLAQFGGNYTAVQFNQPGGMAFDQYNLYVANLGASTSAGRVIKINNFNGAYPYSSNFGATTNFGTIYDVAVSPPDIEGQRYLYAADNGVIYKRNLVTNTWTNFGNAGVQTNTNQILGLVSSVAVDSAGNVFTLDWGTNRVRKYSSKGTRLAEWYMNPISSLNVSYGQPGLAVDSAHSLLYVSDPNRRVIRKYTTSGTYLASLGSGQFGSSSPAGLAVNASGDLYAADPGNNRIIKFSSGGNKLAECKGSDLTNPKGLLRPNAVKLDPSGGYLYISDTANKRVLVFQIKK